MREKVCNLCCLIEAPYLSFLLFMCLISLACFFRMLLATFMDESMYKAWTIAMEEVAGRGGGGWRGGVVRPVSCVFVVVIVFSCCNS